MTSFENIIQAARIDTLRKVGRATCSSDYAVRFYYKRYHPMFFRNRAALEQSLRRMWTIGAFNHRDRAAQILLDECNLSVEEISWLNKWIRPQPFDA